MKDNRNNLKDHFKKNSIPTEAHFADLIDSQLNQNDDGISKPTNEPLTIRSTAVGLPVLRLHAHDAASNDNWQFSSAVGGSHSSLWLSDGNGIPRLLIDGSTGNLGVGTVATPVTKLEVNGTTKTTTLGVGTIPNAGLALHVSGATSIIGNLAVGLTSTSMKLEVNGTTKTTALEVTGNASALGALTLGSNGAVEGYKLYVQGKMFGTALDVYGNTYVTNRLAVGVDPSNAAVSKPFHVAGAGGDFRGTGATELGVVADTSTAFLLLQSKAPGNASGINLSCGADKFQHVRIFASANHILNFSTLNNNDDSLLLNVNGSLQTSSNVLIDGYLTIGSWVIYESSDRLLITRGGTSIAAVSNRSIGNRFEVRTANGYFYVHTGGTYGHSNGTPSLL